MPTHNHANVDRFSGFADTYDAYRPQPPAAVPALLLRLGGIARPGRVVDIGCGTGLSTRVWAGWADEVIGIEPNDDMRRQAAAATQAGHVRYLAGVSTETGLPDGCADVVTISQAFHWMEPAPTLAEVARILRPGGVFATIDCDWPPVMGWEAELAHQTCMARVKDAERAHGISRDVVHRPKEQHLAQIKACGHFRYVREMLVHSEEVGSAARLVGVVFSMGGVESVLKAGVSEDEAGITDLRAEAARLLGEGEHPWTFCYRIRAGVK